MAAKLRLLAINDVYRLDHFPALSTLLQAHRVESPTQRTITCVAGDFLSPNILSNFDKGRGFTKCFNALGVTHACFGNHEADLQLHDLRRRSGELDAVWLNTNIPEFTTDAGAPLPRYDIVEVDGIRFGIIGLLTDEKQIFFTDTFKGLQIENVILASERMERFLRQPQPAGEGCDQRAAARGARPRRHRRGGAESQEGARGQGRTQRPVVSVLCVLLGSVR